MLDFGGDGGGDMYNQSNAEVGGVDEEIDSSDPTVIMIT